MNEEMTNVQASQRILGRLGDIEKKLDTLFYYSESEDLLKTEKRGTWNAVEVFFHINLLNESYLDQFPAQVKLAKEASPGKIKRSWIGKKLIEASRVNANDELIKKYTSPKVIDPKAREKAGFAIKEKIVFQELLRDLKEIRVYADLLASKNLDTLKVKTLLPLLKVNLADALFIITEHTYRHILQAERILKS
jgi:hypothetical protein